MTAHARPQRTMTLPDGRQVAFCEYGTTDGRPVLYCHGMPGSRLEHTHAAALASAGGQRVIVPDRPGYGASTAQPGRSVSDFAGDAAALMDHLDLEAFDVIGFSGGGPHAVACAARMPRRVGRLALVSSWAPFDRTGIEGMAEGFQQLWELARADFSAFSEALAGAVEASGGAYEMLVGGALPVDQAIFEDEDLAAAYRANLTEGVRHGLDGMLEDAGAMIADWQVDFDRVTCPTHLWHGTDDPNAPLTMGQWLQNRLTNARLTEWKGAGHFESFRHWDEILGFLGGRS